MHTQIKCCTRKNVTRACINVLHVPQPGPGVEAPGGAAEEDEAPPGLLIGGEDNSDVEDLDVDAEEEFWRGGEDDQPNAGNGNVPNGGGQRVGGGEVVEENRDDGGSQEQASQPTQGDLFAAALDLPTQEEAHKTVIATHKFPPRAVRGEIARVLAYLC